MKEVGTVLFEVAKMRVDDGFQERQKLILQGKPITRYFPVPLMIGDYLLVGESSVAKAIHQGKTHVYVRKVEGSDDAKLAAREMDRSYGAGDEVCALIEAIAHDISANEPKKKPKGEGRPVTPVGEARRRVARWIDSTEERLKAMEQRQKKAKVEPSSDQKRKWSLHCYNFRPAPGLEERAAEDRRKLNAADFALRRVLAELGSMERTTKAIANTADMAKSYAKIVRDHSPHALCPWCKSTVAVMPVCVACHGLGYVSETLFKQAPLELVENGWVSHLGHILDMRTMKPPFSRKGERGSIADFGDDEQYHEEEEPPL